MTSTSSAEKRMNAAPTMSVVVDVDATQVSAVDEVIAVSAVIVKTHALHLATQAMAGVAAILHLDVAPLTVTFQEAIAVAVEAVIVLVIVLVSVVVLHPITVLGRLVELPGTSLSLEVDPVSLIIVRAARAARCLHAIAPCPLDVAPAPAAQPAVDPAAAVAGMHTNYLRE